MTLTEAVILAIIEGITEFLPVSSTGHMIIASSLMGIADDAFTKTFTVAIQFGTILSVVFLYYKRFLRSIDFYKKLLIAFLPAAVLGFLLDDMIDQLLSNIVVVAVSLVAGGIIFLYIDEWLKGSTAVNDEEISSPRALRIGLFQCIAMIPGVSRSAATIIGGLASGLNRKSAAEFSFFLAVPTMFAATVYKVFKFTRDGSFNGTEQINLLIIGNVIGFAVALIAIRSFIGYLSKHGFVIFGWYRIILGVLILLLNALGYNLQLTD